MRTNLHRALSLAALVALPLGAAACGGDDDEATGGDDAPAGDVVQIEALDSLAFDPDAIEVPAGETTFELSGGSIQHSFVIEGLEDDLRLVVNGGDADSGTITLEAGEYTFYCDIPGHQAGGMEGTLTVG